MDVCDVRLVSVVPPSSQLDSRDKLWRLHSALLQCRTLLERAATKEDEELGANEEGRYEKQREVVKHRLSLLLINTAELLKAADGAAVLAPDLDDFEVGVCDKGGVQKSRCQGGTIFTFFSPLLRQNV